MGYEITMDNISETFMKTIFGVAITIAIIGSILIFIAYY